MYVFIFWVVFGTRQIYEFYSEGIILVHPKHKFPKSSRAQDIFENEMFAKYKAYVEINSLRIVYDSAILAHRLVKSLPKVKHFYPEAYNLISNEYFKAEKQGDII